jgi:hypothetical protein
MRIRIARGQVEPSREVRRMGMVAQDRSTLPGWSKVLEPLQTLINVYKKYSAYCPKNEPVAEEVPPTHSTHLGRHPTAVVLLQSFPTTSIILDAVKQGTEFTTAAETAAKACLVTF